MVNRHDQIMTPVLAIYGEYGEDEFELLGKYLKPGMTVLDIGANIGTHAIAFAEMVTDTGCVLCFEPMMYNFHLLCANIAMNGSQRIYPHRMIVGDHDDDYARLPQIDGKQRRNFGMYKALKEVRGQGIPTPIVTIDSLDMTRCDLIKIDVEGSEFEVLDGARETIEEFSPVIQAECNEDDKESAARLLPFFREMGYKTYWSYNRLHRPNNYKCSKTEKTGRDRNIIAVRTRLPQLTEGLEPCSQ